MAGNFLSSLTAWQVSTPVDLEPAGCRRTWKQLAGKLPSRVAKCQAGQLFFKQLWLQVMLGVLVDGEAPSPCHACPAPGNCRMKRCCSSGGAWKWGRAKEELPLPPPKLAAQSDCTGCSAQKQSLQGACTKARFQFWFGLLSPSHAVQGLLRIAGPSRFRTVTRKISAQVKEKISAPFSTY